MNQLLQPLINSQTLSTIQQRALEVYASVLPQLRPYLTWILSKTTMEMLVGHDLKDQETIGAYLFQRPVRRDDSVWGIGYEVMEKL